MLSQTHPQPEPNLSTRALSTEEVFAGLEELFGLMEPQEAAVPDASTAMPDVSKEGIARSFSLAPESRLEIEESSEGFSVRAELPAANLPAGARPRRTTHAHRKPAANPVLRVIDILADGDRETTTATLKGGTLEVKTLKKSPKARAPKANS